MAKVILIKSYFKTQMPEGRMFYSAANLELILNLSTSFIIFAKFYSNGKFGALFDGPTIQNGSISNKSYFVLKGRGILC
jgi:hypothetical protein